MTQKLEKPERSDRSESWDLTTTATTADQEIGSYTPKVLKHFVIQAIIVQVYFTTLSTTAALLGKLSLYFPEKLEYILKDIQAANTSSGALFGFIIQFPKGYSTKHYREQIKAICTPATATSIKWIVTLLGYDE